MRGQIAVAPHQIGAAPFQKCVAHLYPNIDNQLVKEGVPHLTEHSRGDNSQFVAYPIACRVWAAIIHSLNHRVSARIG